MKKNSFFQLDSSEFDFELLQEYLFDLEEANLAQTVDYIARTSFAQSNLGLIGLCHNFINIFRYSPHRIPSIVRVIEEIFSFWRRNESFREFPQRLLDYMYEQIFHRFSFREAYVGNFAFIFHLYTAKILSLNTIVEKLDPIIRAPFKQTRCTEYGTSVSPLYIICFFSYFGPHIQKEAPDIFNLYEQLITEENAPQCFDAEEIEFYFFKEYQQLRKDDWKIWRQHFEQHITHSIGEAIRKDDIDYIQNITRLPDFDFNQRLMPTIFEPSIFIHYSRDLTGPTLLQMAAFHSATKIFKFLLMNDADCMLTDLRKRALTRYAIAGGNFEIIRMVEQKSSFDKNDIVMTIEFHHTLVFNWLFSLFFTESPANGTEKLNKEAIDPLVRNAATVNNISVLKTLLSNGANVNACDDFNWTPLHYACEKNNFESVKIILEQPGVLLNVQDQKGWTPLHRACIRGNYIIVDLLLKHPEVDINIQNYSGRNSLHRAARDGHTKVLSLLLSHHSLEIGITDKVFLYVLKGEPQFILQQLIIMEIVCNYF